MPFFLKHSNFNDNFAGESPMVVGNAPCVIDGVDIINTLCPVNKKTGLRENILSLLKKLVSDPSKKDLLLQCLHELPTNDSPQGVSDDILAEFCEQRLSVGTPAENAELRQQFMNVYEHSEEIRKSLTPQQAEQIQPNVEKPSVAVNVESE